MEYVLKSSVDLCISMRRSQRGRSWRDLVVVLSDAGLSMICLVLCLEGDQVKKVVLCLVLLGLKFSLAAVMPPGLLT